MDKTQRINLVTKHGNTLQLFYNPENDLVVLDLIRKDEKGGNELLRQTLDEKSLLTLLLHSWVVNKICESYEQPKESCCHICGGPNH